MHPRTLGTAQRYMLFPGHVNGPGSRAKSSVKQLSSHACVVCVCSIGVSGAVHELGHHMHRTCVRSVYERVYLATADTSLSLYPLARFSPLLCPAGRRPDTTVIEQQVRECPREPGEATTGPSIGTSTRRRRHRPACYFWDSCMHRRIKHSVPCSFRFYAENSMIRGLMH